MMNRKRRPRADSGALVNETLRSMLTLPLALSRRAVVAALAVAALLPAVPANAAADAQLPLKTTGLEHMGTVVPDVTAAAKFYGRLFNPEVHKEKDPPLRYYVTL